jgi:hypothetical protein
MDHDLDIVPDGQRPQEPRRRGWAGWLISAAFHGMLIAVCAAVYWLIETEAPPPLYPDIVPLPAPTVEVRTPKQPVDPVQQAVPDLEDAVVAETSVPMDAVELVELDGGGGGPIADEAPTDDAFEPIGAGMGGNIGFGPGIGRGAGDGIGPFTQRRRIHRIGDPNGRDRTGTITAALRWLKRHQSANGSWQAARYAANCSEDPKCEPGDATVGGDVDVALTGYAVMCFLGSGYDHVTPNRFRATVRQGIAALLAAQQADGLLGSRNYEHAIAAKALIEAYGMTGDPALKDPASRAVKVILARQNPDPSAADQAYGGLGWDYAAPGDRNDSSVTGWNIMVLKSALICGFDVGHGLDGARQWLTRSWRAANPGWKSLDPYQESRFPYTYAASSGAIAIAPAPGPGAPSADAHDLACVGLMSAVFLGSRSGDTMLETLANDVDRHELPAAYPCNTYKLYYDCLGIFQVGGEKWKRWDARVTRLLAGAQRHDGCFDGSWDFQGTGFHGHQAGRVLSTVYCCLSLEACYLYQRAAAGH